MPSSVSILVGKGDGTFAPAVSYPAGGYQPQSVAVGDFNRDGQPDLALADIGQPPPYSKFPSSPAPPPIGSVIILLGRASPSGIGVFDPATGLWYLRGAAGGGLLP